MIRIERQQEQEGDWLLVSVESALYVVILLAALAMRFLYLGYWPLLSGEVRQAWDAWNLLQGGAPETTSFSPLLFSGNLFNFFAFGASDATARFWPAVFGALLVFLPYLLRHKLGRSGALVAAALLAISPTFVYFSRTLDGSIVAAACALGLIVATGGYIASAGAPDARRSYLYAGAIILPLALMSGPMIYTFVLAALCFAAYVALSLRRGTGSDEHRSLQEAWRALKNDPNLLKAGLLAATILVLVGSALVFNISGWQATLNQLGQWLQQFTKSAGAANPLYYLQLLAIYETLPLLAGLAGLFLAIRRGNLFSVLLSIWFVIALLVHSIAGARLASAAPMILLPLVLLAAQALGKLIEAFSKVEPANWLFLALAIILGAFFYLQLATLSNSGEVVYLRLALVTIGVLLLSFAVFWYWMGSEQALPVGGAALLLALTLMFVHSTMQLNYYTARDPREPINQSPTATDMMSVKSYLEDQSARATGDRTTMPILIEKSVHPLASWYARDLRTVHWAESLPTTLEDKALITAVREGQTPPTGYVGQRFRTSEHANLDGLGASDWLKWYLRRYEVSAKSSDMLEIWVKP